MVKLIRPSAVTDAVLISSNVVETAPAAYNGATTYAAGVSVSVSGAGKSLTVYVSLQAGNTGNAPASSPAWWERTGDTFEVWSSLVTYAAGDTVIAVAADSHHTYESLAGGNLNNAVTDATKWLDLGSTNQRKMFDEVVQSQTGNPDSIEVALAVPGRIDSVILQNLSAAEARVRMTDSVEGLVFDETYPLVSDSGIIDWWAYFNEPIVRATDLSVTDMPPYSDATVEVTLTDSGNQVLCGACVVGLSKDLGNTQYGASVGIQDFSRVSEDAFGNRSVTRRAYSRRGSFTFWIPAAQVDEVFNLLAGYRATPIVVIGSALYGATIIYGFVTDFRIEIPYPTRSLGTLEMEGLT